MFLYGESVVDNFRIKSSLPTITYCLEAGASLVLMSHLGRPKGKKIKEMSLVPVGKKNLPVYFKCRLNFSDDCISQDALDVSLGIETWEKYIFRKFAIYKEEELNDDEFSSKIGKTWTDFYK